MTSNIYKIQDSGSQTDYSQYRVASGELGKRIAVASAKGGAGSTSVAANLAWVLSQQLDKRVACADLDFVSGDLDLHLNISANNRLTEMLQYPERLEPIVFERSGVKAAEKLHVFTGYSQQLAQEFWPDSEALEATSQFCQQQTDYLIWDIPSFCLRDSVGFEAIRSADIRIVIVEPTLASIRHTNQLLTQLATDHDQQTILILNHTKPEKASLISLTDVNQALGQSVDLVIPFSPEKMLSTATLGSHVADDNGRLGRVFKQLAARVTGEQVAPVRRMKLWFRRD